jgi:hypothetical protein
VDLGPLAVELGLGDVARISEERRVDQAAGKHRRNERHGVRIQPGGRRAVGENPAGVAGAEALQWIATVRAG